MSGTTTQSSSGSRDTATWLVKIDERATAVVRTVIEDYDLWVDEITFTSNEGSGLTTNTIRGLHLGEFRQRITDLIRDDPDVLAKPRQIVADMMGLPEPEPGELTTLAKYLRKGPSKGRAAHSPEFHRATALMYLKLWPQHGQRVVKAMAEEMGRPRDTVSTWVRRSREEGWLSKGTQGKAGGEPGPKLVEWMKEK